MNTMPDIRTDLTEQQAIVYAIVTSEKEMHRTAQIHSDREVAERIERDDVLEAAREAAMRHRRQFSRRWQCSFYMYDEKQLQTLCALYDMPLVTHYGSMEKLQRFANARKHTCNAGNGLSTMDEWGNTHASYHMLCLEYRRKTGAKWTQLHGQCSLLSSQLLLTHVHLYYRQETCVTERIRSVIRYVYGNGRSGNTTAMLKEASEWLAVLVQLVMKFEIHYVMDRSAVEMILRQLLRCHVPTHAERMNELRVIRYFTKREA